MSPLSSNNNKHDQETKASSNDMLDVLIIGAGWAGLTTAKELLQAKGVSNIKIIEGRSTHGGRCRSQVMDDGVSIAELGAQWIHGARKTNPIYKAALQAGVPLHRSSYQSQVLYQSTNDGKCRVVPKDKYEFMYDYLMQGKGGFMAYQAHRQDDDDDDVTLRECANDYLDKIDATDEQRLWMEYILESEFVQEYSGAVEDMSMFWWDEDIDMEGGDVEMGATGYRGILEHYVRDIEHLMQFGSKVTAIDWSQEDCVTVHYLQNGQAHQLSAKRVVVTVPVGVLQAKTIDFQPPLPAAKQKAIAGIGMGILNKCLFLWDDSDADKLPWPKDTDWIERIANPNSPNDQQGLWTEHYNLQGVTGRPMLCAFTAGRVAAKVEQWSDQEIRESAWAALQHQFSTRDIPEPKQVVITKWGQDEWSYGSYTYNNIGGKHSNRKRLAEPLDSKLYFAGEGCHSQYFGTTQGALLSGVTAAKQIIGQVQKEQKKQEAAAAKQPQQPKVLATSAEASSTSTSEAPLVYFG